MPRYRSQGLHNVSGEVSRAVAMREALTERPLIPRSYDDRVALERLRHRLAATEQWVSRLDSAWPARLMVAGTIQPRELAVVFDDLASACHDAAPPAAGVKPSSDAQVWSREPESDGARADRLIHALSLLGEHVGGCWSWVPSQSPIRPDGVVNDDVPWELEYSPPPASLLEVIGSRGVLDEATLQESTLDDQHPGRSVQIHNMVLGLAASAVGDLQEKMLAENESFGEPDIRAALGARDEDLLRVHDDLVLVVSDLQAAAQERGGASRGVWAALHDRLVTSFDIWIERVLPATPLGRVRRQSLKRDMPRSVGYVAQYALLLRGNAASLEFLRMVGYVREVCRALVKVIDSMAETSAQRSSTGQTVRTQLDRLLVASDTESRWRRMFGAKAAGVGRFVAAVVGETGQKKPLPQRDLLPIAEESGLLTASAASSRADGMESLLVKMQLCGLAAKIPAAVFRESTACSRVSAPRQRIYAARDWWLNPLGAALSSQRR